jgi:hypothetical protein
VVSDGLAVGGHGLNLLQRQIGLGGHGCGDAREALAQLDVQNGQLAERRPGLDAARGQGVDALLELARQRLLAEGQ